MDIRHQRTQNPIARVMGLTAIAFAAGGVCGWVLGSRQPPPQTPAPMVRASAGTAYLTATTAPARPGAIDPPASSGAEPVPTTEDAATAPRTTVPGSEAEWQALQSLDPEELLQRLHDDAGLATAMADLLLRPTSDPTLKQFVAAALSQSQPELLERSAEAMLGSPDTQARQRAFELLRALPTTPRALEAAARLEALNGSDPQVTSQAVQTLRNSGALASWREDEALALQLRQHTRSADASLRRESLAALVLVDRTLAVEPFLFQGMADPDPSVQSAAIAAIVDAGIRSAQARDTLFQMASTPHADEAVRADALRALQAFRLSPEQAAQVAALPADGASPH